eukprot:TRINITY_DN4720_c0_g1_i1.p1 TRINITY_DN4720_c0_g1~~TRINITY_DN4720_c0_g1_i1.p1  ORF type:complete len:727 (-),score=178.94 TRINITY_DN4720_c0_g1_i1:27-2207(-)
MEEVVDQGRRDPKYHQNRNVKSCAVKKEPNTNLWKFKHHFNLTVGVGQTAEFAVTFPSSFDAKSATAKFDKTDAPTEVEIKDHQHIQITFVPPATGIFYCPVVVNDQKLGELKVICSALPTTTFTQSTPDPAIGKPVLLNAHFSSALTEDLAIYVADPNGHIEPATITPGQDGNYEISFVPSKSGTYTGKLHRGHGTGVTVFSVVVPSRINKSQKEWLDGHPQFRGIGVEQKSFPKDKNARIVILGAGPSGLSTAHYLRKHGYNNLTILEKLDVVGGKSKTWVDKEQNVPHDTGTTSIGPTYDFFRDLLAEATTPENGLAEEEVVPPSNWNGYRIYTQDPLFKKALKKEKKDFLIGLNPWVFAKTEEQTVHKALHWLPDTLQLYTIQKDIAKYKKAVDEIFGSYGPFTMPPKPMEGKDINISMLKFLQLHSPALIPLISYGLSGHGYGHLDEIPFFYGVFFLPPATLEQFINPFAKYPAKTTLKSGWRNFWEKIVEFNKLNVLYEFDLKDIKRTAETVTVTGTHKGAPWQENFDFIFIGAPPTPGELALDWNEEEKDIFSRLKYHILSMTLYKRSPVPDLKEFVYVWVDKVADKERYHSGEVIVIRDAYRACRKDFQDKKKDRYQVGAQSFLDGQFTEEEVIEKLREHLAKMDDPNIDVLEYNPWKYFYYFNCEDIAAGYPWKLLDLQGKNRTAFIHASAAFESINECLSYTSMVTDFLAMACPKV